MIPAKEARRLSFKSEIKALGALKTEAGTSLENHSLEMVSDHLLHAPKGCVTGLTPHLIPLLRIIEDFENLCPRCSLDAEFDMMPLYRWAEVLGETMTSLGVMRRIAVKADPALRLSALLRNDLVSFLPWTHSAFKSFFGFVLQEHEKIRAGSVEALKSGSLDAFCLKLEKELARGVGRVVVAPGEWVLIACPTVKTTQDLLFYQEEAPSDALLAATETFRVQDGFYLMPAPAFELFYAFVAAGDTEQIEYVKAAPNSDVAAAAGVLYNPEDKEAAFRTLEAAYRAALLL